MSAEMPASPPSPFLTAECAQKEAAEVGRQEGIAAEALRGAREARQFSDNYVLRTVVFGSVRFFGGIARALESRSVRPVLAALAVVLFLATLSGLVTMPLCQE